MGQKVHPIGFRLGVTRTWESRWYHPREYVKCLHEDVTIRREVKTRFRHAGIAKVEIERASNRVQVTIHTARPGIIIGRKGVEIEGLRSHFAALTSKQVVINIEEIKKADTVAQLVAENIANQLVRRIGFRRAMKRTVLQTMKAGALGVKVMCAGRLGGTEMSRREWYREGRVPLHTLRADIDYGFTEAKTKYGQIGVKVWIFRGEIFEETTEESELPALSL